MRCHECVAVAGLIVAFCGPLHAQQPVSNDAKTGGVLRLHVVVTNGLSKSSGLATDRFKVLDNGVSQSLVSFKEVTAPATPVGVLIVVDAVNTPYPALVYQRDQIEKYLRANDGRLTHATSVAVLTDKGFQLSSGPSKDGVALANALAHYDAGLRVFGSDQGFYGAQERLTISLNGLQQIAAYEKNLPGRKLVVWVSPGWPLLSGVQVQLGKNQEQRIYGNIASFSTQLRDADITLDSVNSWGAAEPLQRATYYDDFLDGVRKPDKAQLGHLGLQVLALQSGGVALNSSDVVGSIRQSVADADDYYELSFTPSPSAEPNEYHQLQVEVAGLKTRTRQSYYNQP